MVSDGEPRATNEALSLDDGGATGWGLSSAGGAAPGVALAAFASTGSQLLMVGGSAGELLPVTRAEQPDGGALVQELYVPEPVRAAAGAWAPASGEVLVFGGETYNGLTAVVQRLAVEAKRVSQGASAPEPFAGAAAAVVGSKAWVVGGYTFRPDGAPQALSAVRVYDVAGNAWRTSGDGQASAPPALPAPRHSGALVELGGKLWLLGGAGADGRPVAEVLRLDPSAAAPAWEVVTALPTPRALLAAVGIGTRLMAIGGVGAAGQPLDTVEVYQP
jgi:N-acetylneuraminic acid mutarotase